MVCGVDKLVVEGVSGKKIIVTKQNAVGHINGPGVLRKRS